MRVRFTQDMAFAVENGIEHKRCMGCKELQEVDQFSKDSKGSGGLSSYCRSCWRTRRSVDYCPDKARSRHRKKTYGLKDEDYSSLLNSQKGCCAICKLPENKVRKNGTVYAMAIDHCHTTGKVRGLLCNNCNTALGSFKDNVEFLSSAINYLNLSKAVNDTNRPDNS